MRRHVGIDRHSAAVQGHVAAVGHAHGAIDGNRVRGGHADGAQFEAVQACRIEHQAPLARRWQQRAQVQACGDIVGAAGQLHVAHDGAQAVVRQARALFEHGHGAADDQLAARGGGLVRLMVAIDTGLRRLLLARALDGGGVDQPFQHGRLRTDHQLAGIASHRIPVFQSLERRDQRTAVGSRGRLAPARVQLFKAPVQARVQQVAGGARCFVLAAIGPIHPGLADRAAFHPQGAARQVDAGTGLRDDVLAVKTERAALRHPFSHRVSLHAQVAAHLQQAARRVPAVAVIAVRPLGNKHQAAPVQPDIAAIEPLAIAVARCVALFVTLHVDLDVIAFHGQPHAGRARHVDPRAIAHQAAAGRIDADLPTRGQRQRRVLEIHRAGAVDGDARLVAPVRQRQHGRGAGHGRGAQAVALAVERRIARLFLDQDGCRGALSQHHGGLFAQRLQVHRATRVDAGAGQQHTILAHLAPGQGRIAFARLDQPRIGDLACRPRRIEARHDFVATRGGQRIAIRAHALADDEAVASGQQRLSLRRQDLAAVMHLGARQQHITAPLGGIGGRARGEARAAQHVDLAQCIADRWRTAIAVNAALAKLRVADAGGGSHQVARIDLAGAMEDDAVAVDQQHRAVALDAALDLAGTRQRIIDPV